MRVWTGLIFAAAVSACAAAGAPSPAPAEHVRPFAPEEGAAVLSTQDEFTRELTLTDLSIRLQNPQGGNVDALMALYRSSTLPWTEAETARLTAMIARVRARVEALAQWLPPEVGLVKASDRVEGGFPHTRSNIISFGPGLPDDDAELDELFFHELFHVLSRKNAARHDEIYGLIGFLPCTEVTLPERVRLQRITNPDAPVDRHVAPIAGQPGRYVLPRLMAAEPAFDPANPAFPAYFDLQFYVMARDGAGRCAPVEAAAEPVTLAPRAAMAALQALAGVNTGYVFHPEEMLADNFAQLMMGKTDVPNPEVHQRLAAFLGLDPAQLH